MTSSTTNNVTADGVSKPKRGKRKLGHGTSLIVDGLLEKGRPARSPCPIKPFVPESPPKKFQPKKKNKPSKPVAKANTVSETQVIW